MRPDHQQFLQCIRRQPTARPVLYEHYIEWAQLRRMLGGDSPAEPGWTHGWVVDAMRAMARMGHDVYAVPVAHLGAKRLMYPLGERGHGASVSQNAGAMIADRAAFDAYPWPDPEADDYLGILDGVASRAPAGMAVVADLQGCYDLTVDLLGYERMCLLLADQPDLVEEVMERIGRIQLRAAERLLAHPLVVGIEVCDDWGHRTGTSLSPASLRRLALPHHRRMVAAAHAVGKVAILHACGRVDALMEDVIAMGYDAKHSYEDAITPVEEAIRRWGGRIAILGGIDNDFLTRRPATEVAQRARALLASAPTGYALGSGNSITADMPVDNVEALCAAVQEVACSR